jgi:hypothetical protein
MKKFFLLAFLTMSFFTQPKATWLWASDDEYSEAYGLVPYKDTIFPGSLVVYGVLKSSASVFKKAVEIFGILLADKSRFEKKIVLHGTAELSYTLVKDDIEVKADTEKPIIHLRSCTIYGDILFEARGGIVYAYDNTEIKGSVIGGKIVRV